MGSQFENGFYLLVIYKINFMKYFFRQKSSIKIFKNKIIRIFFFSTAVFIYLINSDQYQFSSLGQSYSFFPQFENIKPEKLTPLFEGHLPGFGYQVCINFPDNNYFTFFSPTKIQNLIFHAKEKL